MKYILILLLLSSCAIGGKYKTATGLNHKEQKKWVKEIRKETKQGELSNRNIFFRTLKDKDNGFKK